MSTQMPLDHTRDHSDLEMDNLAKPNPILKLKRSLRSIRSLQTLATSSAPSWHFHWFSAYSYGNPCGFRAFCACIQYVAIASISQPTHYSLHIYDLKDHIMWEKHHRSREGNALYQGRRSGWHLLLDHLPYGQHRSRIFNASRPRSCDRS